jgi:hypothetical protein
MLAFSRSSAPGSAQTGPPQQKHPQRAEKRNDTRTHAPQVCVIEHPAPYRRQIHSISQQVALGTVQSMGVGGCGCINGHDGGAQPSVLDSTAVGGSEKGESRNLEGLAAYVLACWP